MISQVRFTELLKQGKEETDDQNTKLTLYWTYKLPYNNKTFVKTHYFNKNNTLVPNYGCH